MMPNDKLEACMAGIVIKIDEDLFDLVPGYLQNRRQDISKMRESLAQGDFESIKISGHSMKGSGGGYGFDEITEIGGLIEKAAKENNGVVVGELIARLADYLANIEVVRDVGE